MITEISPTHPSPMPLTIGNNQLMIAGYGIEQLAAIAGQTPFYVYDSQRVLQKFQHLRQNLPQQIKIHYAIKANPMPALVEKMAVWADGLDVASAKELHIAMATEMSHHQISMAGPGKSKHDIEAAVAAGVVINLESRLQFEQACSAAKKLHKKARLAIRINPDFQLKSSGMKMAGGAQPFGIDVEQVSALIESIQKSKQHFVGFHIFTGSQNLNADAIIQAHQAIFELASRLCRQSQVTLDTLNIGGGLGVPYFPGEKAIKVDAISQNLQQLLSQYPEFENTEIIMELGRYLVADAGAYICQVVDIKQSQQQTFAVTNGGLHHHLAATGNFGQVLRKNYPIIKANQFKASTLEKVNIVGPLCTPLDLLGKNLELPPLQIGDYIAILLSGAYGYTASPHGFLSHPEPIELLF